MRHPKTIAEVQARLNEIHVEALRLNAHLSFLLGQRVAEDKAGVRVPAPEAAAPAAPQKRRGPKPGSKKAASEPNPLRGLDSVERPVVARARVRRTAEEISLGLTPAEALARRKEQAAQASAAVGLAGAPAPEAAAPAAPQKRRGPKPGSKKAASERRATASRAAGTLGVASRRGRSKGAPSHAAPPGLFGDAVGAGSGPAISPLIPD